VYGDGIEQKLLKEIGFKEEGLFNKIAQQSNKVVDTIHGVNVTYTEVDDDAIPSLAANSNEQGIKIRKNITVDSVINYMLGNHVQGDKGKQAKVDVKNEVTAKINEEYGVNFLEILKGLSNTEIRNFILLHEYRHTQQRDKRNTTEEFIADYNADKVTFEKDANVYALKRMQLLPGKPSVTEESTATGKTITYTPTNKDTQTYTIRGSRIFNKKNEEVFKGDSVDRNKIFANLAIREGRAQIVEHEKNGIKTKYVVNDKQQIMSVATGNIMKWAENHGTRKAILSKLKPTQQSAQPVQPSSEISSKGGFENKGKGTPQGDGKDKAMRKIADSAIVELVSDKPSSSKTTIDQLGEINENSNIIMLARNGTLKGKPLRDETKKKIDEVIALQNKNNVSIEFVVGDMPGVDSQFIDYLQKVGAKFTIYHTGDTSRIAIPTIQSTQQSSEASFKFNNNLSLQESELDVHTLSVLFPAAINADGTLKTGDTADAVIGKLGKFLKVCE
jgi:hypothetical protein